MIILTSPTKQMDFKQHLPDIFLDPSYDPIFKDKAGLINNLLKMYNLESLASLMKISPAIAMKTFNNIQMFDSTEVIARPALMAYSGTVFKAINPLTFNAKELVYAQTHLRIMSGLYGILRPLDRICPYRLEMKTGIEIPGEGRLSAFWKSRIASALADDKALAKPDSLVINLASEEYSRIVDKALLKRKIIDFHFKEKTDNGLKTVGMYAKTARGLMIRRIINERVQDPNSLTKGITGGYSFVPEFSNDYEWVFVR